ncbi:hypothetical protein K474DRAFT_1701604 [Panus rudis PR-1116 ss-1]|nr:hypothetical protein K474DRAFT_1701604 [Panus rudis PR-1116 ss-1]
MQTLLRRRRRSARTRNARTASIPEKPNRYANGSSDIDKFYRFCTEIKDYTDEYKIHPKRLATTVSRFLDGRAWNYYTHVLTREVQRGKAHTLKEILVGLFDYCFPLNFKEKLQTKAKNFRQGGLDVREYIYKLETLLDLAGINEEKDRVHHLWDGLHVNIRTELTSNKVTTATHTWDQIRHEAEFAEATIELREEAERQKARANKATGIIVEIMVTVMVMVLVIGLLAEMPPLETGTRDQLFKSRLLWMVQWCRLDFTTFESAFL